MNNPGEQCLAIRQILGDICEFVDRLWSSKRLAGRVVQELLELCPAREAARSDRIRLGESELLDRYRRPARAASLPTWRAQADRCCRAANGRTDLLATFNGLRFRNE